MALVDIIVILYGDTKDYDRLVKSIEENCGDYNLITIDNNPPNENLGFTKAVNKGITQGKADFTWLLNQDAVVLPGAMEGLVKRLRSHPKNGIAGSVQLDYIDQDLAVHLGTSRAFPGGVHKSGRISMGHGRFPEKQTWVNFASVMLKRDMIEEIGPLDAKMFLVYSDSDYCYFARSKGWDCWFEPSSKVLHRLNASKTVTEWHQKDMQAFMEKWGIQHIGNNNFAYSPLFAKLDRFP